MTAQLRHAIMYGNGDEVELTNYKALKLDASWQPLDIIPSFEALVLSLDDKCMIVETWDRKIRSQHKSFDLPSVIVLKNYRASKAHKSKCTKQNIISRDNNTCQYCGRSDCKMTIDHVVPRSKGGKFSWDNLVSACPACNQKKGDRSLHESNMRLLSIPQEPKIHLFKKRVINPDQNWNDYLGA